MVQQGYRIAWNDELRLLHIIGVDLLFYMFYYIVLFKPRVKLILGTDWDIHGIKS